MAKYLTNTADLTAVANAIRAKSGTVGSLTFPNGFVSDISGITTKENLTWHQCPEAVRNYLNYLAEHPYGPSDYSYTYINTYAPATAVDSNTKPIENVFDGETFANEIPNGNTPFSSTNYAGTINPLDRLRWFKTTTANPAPGSQYKRGMNCRDLGGWACDGGTIKYGVLVRGSEPNPADKHLMVDIVGIKTEVQLLPVSEQADDYKMISAWGIDWAGNDTANDSLYSTSDSPALWKKILSEIFESVTHDKPVYFHCGVGADRTGMMAIMLEGILGVSQGDIDTDFELTDFALGWESKPYGIYRSRNYVTYSGDISQGDIQDGVITAIKDIPLVGGLSDTFRNHCISFVASLGFTAAEINAFRAACIDGTPDTITLTLDSRTITKTLTNVSLDNTENSIDNYQPYVAKVTPASGYVISSVSVTMGGNTISAFSGTKTNLFYSVTNSLSHCATNNKKNSCIAGQGYGATITADTGYTLTGATVSVMVGGVEMASTYYSDGKISIPNVTGNITISVTAVSQGPAYTNLADVGGSDWKASTRITGGGGLSSSTAADVTNVILVAAGDTIRMKHACGDTSGYNSWNSSAISAVFADSSATTGTVFTRQNTSYDSANDIVTFNIPSGTNGYMRLMVLKANYTSDLIITVNEPIE